jgi:hypothetical protein
VDRIGGDEKKGQTLMARTLKTYITNLGFFELALAAPSMKAALEAWGLGHNAFHHGFAKETGDPKIVAAAMAKPGVVLKRPVGSKGAFREDAKLPKDWSLPADGALPKPKAKKQAKPARKPAKKDKAAEKAGRAAIISFETEKARREKARERQAAEEEAREEKTRARRERETQKAQAALDRSEARHEETMEKIAQEQDKLERRAKLERERWDEEREDLKAALRRARD